MIHHYPTKQPEFSKYLKKNTAHTGAQGGTFLKRFVLNIHCKSL